MGWVKRLVPEICVYVFQRSDENRSRGKRYETKQMGEAPGGTPGPKRWGLGGRVVGAGGHRAGRPFF